MCRSIIGVVDILLNPTQRALIPGDISTRGHTSDRYALAKKNRWAISLDLSISTSVISTGQIYWTNRKSPLYKTNGE